MDAVTHLPPDISAHFAALPARRQPEAARLHEIFAEVTGYTPRLISGRMIGYGSYAYTYESGRSGTALATGFAINAAKISLYIMPGYAEFPDIMSRLGPYKSGKACVYLTRLETTDQTALADLIRAGLDDLGTRWPITAT